MGLGEKRPILAIRNHKFSLKIIQWKPFGRCKKPHLLKIFKGHFRAENNASKKCPKNYYCLPKIVIFDKKISRTSSGVMRLKISKSSSVIWFAKSLTGILVTSNNAGSKDFSSSKSTPLINGSFLWKFEIFYEFWAFSEQLVRFFSPEYSQMPLRNVFH